MPSPVFGLLGRSARLHHLCPPLWSLFFYLTAQLLALTYSHKCTRSIPSSQLHSSLPPSRIHSHVHPPVHSSATHSLFTHSLLRTHLHIQLLSLPWQLHPGHRRAHNFSEVNLLLSCIECISDFSIFNPPRINLCELCSVFTLVYC